MVFIKKSGRPLDFKNPTPKSVLPMERDQTHLRSMDDNVSSVWQPTPTLL